MVGEWLVVLFKVVCMCITQRSSRPPIGPETYYTMVVLLCKRKSSLIVKSILSEETTDSSSHFCPVTPSCRTYVWSFGLWSVWEDVMYLTGHLIPKAKYLCCKDWFPLSFLPFNSLRPYVDGGVGGGFFFSLSPRPHKFFRFLPFSSLPWSPYWTGRRSTELSSLYTRFPHEITVWLPALIFLYRRSMRDP